MKNDMPREMFIGIESVQVSYSEFSNTYISSPFKTDGYTKYTRADLTTPQTKMVNVPYADGSPSREWCVEPVIDDGLLAEAVELFTTNNLDMRTVQRTLTKKAYSALQTIITHALKTRDKVTNEHRIKVLREMGFGHEMINDSHIITYDGYKGFFINHTNLMCAMQRIPRAFTVLINAALKLPNNRDEEKI